MLKVALKVHSFVRRPDYRQPPTQRLVGKEFLAKGLARIGASIVSYPDPGFTPGSTPGFSPGSGDKRS